MNKVDKPTIDNLVKAKASEKVFDENTRMPFGKHQGQELYSIPRNYFLWLLAQDWVHDKYPGLIDYIEGAL